MAVGSTNPKKRRSTVVSSGRRHKRLRPEDYHSSSSSASEDEEEELPQSADPEIQLNDEDETARNTALNTIPPSDGEDDDDDDAIDADAEALSDASSAHSLAPNSSASASSDSDPDTHSQTSSNPNLRRVKKRNDPSAFAASLATILSSSTSSKPPPKPSTSTASTSLPTSSTNTPAPNKTPTTTKADPDPVLSRSATARSITSQVRDSHLDSLARRRVRQSKKQLQQKGRIADVLLGDGRPGEAEEIAERERRLKKTAQRGVVRLFNAVRAAQIRGEEAQRAVRGGAGARREGEEVGSRVSKEGFLEMIASGGRKSAV